MNTIRQIFSKKKTPIVKIPRNPYLMTGRSHVCSAANKEPADNTGTIRGNSTTNTNNVLSPGMNFHDDRF